MKRIIFATTNKNKVKEVNMMMEDFDVELVTMKEAGIDVDIVENGTTFEENAIIKARTIMEMTGEIAIADDSGLEVDYLDGAPGIYSARFLGEDTSYDIKNNYIIDKLKNVKGKERSARFVCAMAAAFPNGDVLTCKGTIEGVIALEQRGTNGFGYDPIVYVPEYEMTTGEMAPELKNSISHRGKALEQMKEILRTRLEREC
ncbi:XTP/dITP diphosphatase [uncultured Eubacterium sp.]|uniref:XTP/dITP diphosphatase n=1 Tax=uncultured Eubacterium sp. TaxID=165185 RepID=UPI00267319F2|nr:XTP/dITP diphosphatase [uncultured Eubacterium sp.]